MDADRIAGVCEAFGPVRPRRPFGGTGIHAGGVTVAPEADGTLCLKACDALAKRLAAQGSKPFAHQGKGKLVPMSCRQRPDTAPDDPDEAPARAQAALAVARAARR